MLRIHFVLFVCRSYLQFSLVWLLVITRIWLPLRKRCCGKSFNQTRYDGSPRWHSRLHKSKWMYNVLAFVTFILYSLSSSEPFLSFLLFLLKQPFVECLFFSASAVPGLSRYCPLSNGSQHDSISGIWLAPSVPSHPSLLSCYILTAVTRDSHTRSGKCVKRYINKTGIWGIGRRNWRRLKRIALA